MKNERKTPTPEIDGRYAAHVRCEKGHSGNRRYAPANGDWWQCAGCGDFVSAATIICQQGER